MKKKKYVILGIVTVLLVTVAGVLAYRMQQDKKKEKIKYDGYTDENQETNYITYKGEKYKYNYNLRTVLFMGIDKEGEIEEKKVGGGGQTDSLVLFAMDTEKKTTQALSVSRDTMTDIRTYDMSGEFLSTERAQLALQYAYGDGKAKSCVLTREAVSLVLQAGAYAKGGEIFVLDMGEPVKIADLAKNLIRLSGFKVGEDIEIQYTGLRPGEKLYEELLMDEEGLQATDNNLIHIGKPIDMDEALFMRQLKELKAASEKDSKAIRQMVKEIVPTYMMKEE